MLIILRHHHTIELQPSVCYTAFLVPLFLSFHIPLGATLWACWTSCASNTSRIFITSNPTHPRPTNHFGWFISISTNPSFRPVHSRVRLIIDSHHRYFIDSRHIINHASTLSILGRQTLVTFVPTLLLIFPLFRFISADFTELHTFLTVVMPKPMSEY